MGALAWLIIPVAAVLLAAAWAAWAQRAPKATGDPASLAEHRRFMAAMERTTAGSAGSGERSGR
ncbi:hypothetical protein PUR71_18320 [Streptomyces sp. SP17BM10]|uniref:hypothetical protein n=1 Tax=Streptomyces sp. SP17BM10 TaxID=3002530 RepID=UPI002E780FAA|nr:hypothetical protein [Streptomyces sp. SP17BM10]MEE1784848.1 hypothetical protein [Streptomyces sp. SP17BM10]